MADAYQFLGMPQSQWAFINTFADWLSALGTITVVWVSLWLARKATQPKAKLTANIVLTIGGGVPRQEFLSFAIVNTGDRPIRVTNIGWKVGFFGWNVDVFKKRYAIQLLGSTRLSSPLPIELTHSQTANWFMETDQLTDGETWAQHFASRFIAPHVRSSLWTLRAQAYTSTGHIFTVKPSSDVIKALQKVLQ